MLRSMALAVALLVSAAAASASQRAPVPEHPWHVGRHVPHWWQYKHVDWQAHSFLSEPFPRSYWIQIGPDFLLVQGHDGTVSKVVRQP